MRGPAYKFHIWDREGHKELIIDNSYEKAVRRFRNGKHAEHRLFKQSSSWLGLRRSFRCECGEFIEVEKERI